MDDPVAAGARVVYQGSIAEHNGEEFTVSSRALPEDAMSNDDLRYTLRSVENKNFYLMNVRRASFEVQ